MDDIINAGNDADETEELTTAADVIQKLEEVWKNEKLAPVLLQYEGEIVECLLDQIQHMENSLQRIRKGDFRIVFHKMELDHIKYLLSSYIRTRLEKIEKFGAYLLQEESQEKEARSLMSDEERIFAHKYVSTMSNYLNDVALKNMPSNMQSVKLEEIDSKPQTDCPVFIKVIKECRGVVLKNFAKDGEEEVEVDLLPGTLHVLRYKPIASYLRNGSIQLI